MEVTRVYLIRHAEVENPKNLLYGHLPGFPLSARGRAQARALGDRLRSGGIGLIVHSPLERARETAELIASRLEVPPRLEVDPELREAEMSRHLQGLPYWQIPLRRPRWYVHKIRRGLVSGDESVSEMGGRILAVMRRAVRENPGEVLAYVSHADPLQAAWILLEGRAHNEFEMYRKPVERAGALELILEGERVVEHRYLSPPEVEVATAV